MPSGDGHGPYGYAEVGLVPPLRVVRRCVACPGFLDLMGNCPLNKMWRYLIFNPWGVFGMWKSYPPGSTITCPGPGRKLGEPL